MNQDIRFENDNKMTCKFGHIYFDINDSEMSIFDLYVSKSKRRNGIGSKLIKQLEEYAVAHNVKKIIVPATPSKESLLFWGKHGYSTVFPEDEVFIDHINIELDDKKIFDTPSGVIVLEKTKDDIFIIERKSRFKGVNYALSMPK